MARRLFTVEDRFYIDGRGLIPVPGIVPEHGERYRVGDPIELRRPDGSVLRTRIGGIEMINPTPQRSDTIILLRECTKDDVPVGTEVWSVDCA